MKNIQILKKKLKKLTNELRSIFEKNKIYSKLEQLDKKMLSANFWQDKTDSQKTIKEKKLFEDLINSYEESINKHKDLDDLYSLATEENNINVKKEVMESIKELRSKVKKNEIKCFLSNEADSFDCYVEIHAGAGGTESQDWANMLRRMYMKWSDSKDYKLSLIHI